MLQWEYDQAGHSACRACEHLWCTYSMLEVPSRTKQWTHQDLGLHSSKSNLCSTDCHFLPEGVFFFFFLSLSKLSPISNVLSAIFLIWVVYTVKISDALGVYCLWTLTEKLMALNFGSNLIRLHIVHSQTKKHHLTNVLHISFHFQMSSTIFFKL